MRERKPKNCPRMRETQHSNCVGLGIRCCPSGQNHHTPSNVESPLSARKTTHRTTALLLKVICASIEKEISHGRVSWQSRGNRFAMAPLSRAFFDLRWLASSFWLDLLGFDLTFCMILEYPSGAA